jgi:uncharacterized protein YPO0396
MSTLFNNNNAEGGFRLRYMEVFNWGTFNGKVYRLQTDSRTSLLTGANGSGKTTLIDALLTLLVPSNKRFYNQSSGAENKKERDEASYFWGYFGKTFSDLDNKSKPEQLRQQNDYPYSVLLACFQNAGTLHTISLVQVRWYSNGAIKKVFIVSPYPLNVSEHFGQGHFDLKGEWRKKLAKQFPKTDIYDSFKEYAARFSELFGLRDKALSLFNQTVGIKVLGDLTQFIRQEMLEETDAEEQFKSLYNHYSDLLISHKAIQKDEKQLELLEPIVKNKALLTTAQERVKALELVEEQIPFYINQLEYGLLDTAISQLEQGIANTEKEKALITEQVNSLENDKEQLITQKASLNVDGQIALLKKDIEAETEKQQRKKAVHSQYDGLVNELQLNTDIDAASFQENHVKIVELHTSMGNELESLTEKYYGIKSKKEQTENGITQIQNQITSLLARKNRIPEDLIIARKRLASVLEVSEETIPFAGELIKVRQDEQLWEDSIERILHSFSMQLLVPDTYSKAANIFIHDNDMQAKVVYHKIDSRPTNSLLRRSGDDAFLVNKIEIKDSKYGTWLEHYLLERFNYYCTDDMEVFYGSQKAVTSNGMLRNVNRHEKDDRPGRWNKLKYRLGWDNAATVRYLQEEKRKAEKEYERLGKDLTNIGSQLEAIKRKKRNIEQLVAIKNYDDINWKRHVEKIHTLLMEVEELKTSSDAYQVIVKQLEQVEAALKKAKDENEAIIKKLTKLEEDYNRKNRKKLSIDLDGLTAEGTKACEEFLASVNLSIASVKAYEQVEDFNTSTGRAFLAESKKAAKLVKDISETTIVQIAAFVNPGEKTTTEFPNWSGDVLNIKADLSSLNELEELYNTIQTQRLVENKRRFREYMDKSMLDALTNYSTWLNNEVDKVKEMINELNVPLKKITFNKNPDTYLQLEYRMIRGENEINIFREQLKNAIPNVVEFNAQKNEAYREEIFNQIKILITELQQEEIRRRKVTDIRNWLIFNAQEYSAVDGKKGQYHDNTASYSGGQKAQFTYAILGAAIAYQFGIFQQGRQYKSLRFITVDEAFSKLDPEKSQFLMEFCAQLNLQILVVTPLDKINIAEPYISAVHFVEIKNKKNSVVYNLTMEEYHARKEEFNQLAVNES